MGEERYQDTRTASEGWQPVCGSKRRYSSLHGEYLLALDSDDRIKQNLVRKCVSSLEDSSADLVHFGYSSITESGARVNNHPDPEAEGDESCF